MEHEQIKKIKIYFEKLYGRRLIQSELEEIIKNLIGFFEFLAEYSQKDKEEKESNNNGENSRT